MPLKAAGECRRLPVVSLLTDFGQTEPFVGLVKARILAACPDARIIDLTHELPAYAVEAAAFWIDRSFGFFPAGTVHVCVVDPGVGTARRILLVEHSGQLFLAPDNGLLTNLTDRAGTTVRAVDPGYFEAAGIVSPSATFHARDLFAPLAGRLAARTTRPQEVGSLIDDWLRLEVPRPVVTPDSIRGRILFSDSFGNLFSNIESSSLAPREDWTVAAGGRVLPWVRTYGDAPPGTLVALENSFGVVELACVGGSATGVLGIGAGAEIELSRRTGTVDAGY